MRHYYLSSNAGDGPQVFAYHTLQKRDSAVRDDSTARKITRKQAEKKQYALCVDCQKEIELI